MLMFSPISDIVADIIIIIIIITNPAVLLELRHGFYFDSYIFLGFLPEQISLLNTVRNCKKLFSDLLMPCRVARTLLSVAARIIYVHRGF